MIPTPSDRPDIWTRLAAPLPSDAIQWRQDGRPTARDGKHIARFVAFIDAQFVRERLDSVVPGEWDLTLTELPNRATFDGEEENEPYAFKARIQVRDVMRESVGQGKDYKTAETDAFKRAGVRFGIGAELYSFGPNWVTMDGDGKYAKAIEDPNAAYARRHGGAVAARPTTATSSTVSSASAAHASENSTTMVSSNGAPAVAGEEPSCPKCEGKMWDNRLTKRNPKAPNWKCRDRSCDGVIWPPKDVPNGKPGRESESGPYHEDRELEEIPF